MFLSRKIISIYSTSGERLREIGKYHDPSETPFGSEHLLVEKDKQDNYLVANSWLPVIRKYSSQGRLTGVITYDTPFFIPVTVTLNAKGDEITRMGDGDTGSSKVKENEGGYIIDISRKNKKWKKIPLCHGLYTGFGNNLFFVTSNREGTEKENQGTSVSLLSNYSSIDRSSVDYDIAESTDMFSLYVFNPRGKIIAATKLMTYCDRIYISGNRLFVVDGSFNQRILEYQMKIMP